jgi:arabinogalactan endo-1,4-beta-galactosidase
VRIKLWHALEEKHIEYPKAYIRTMVRNEFNDLPRRRKAPLSLIFDEDGELYMGDAGGHEGVGMADPADEFEESERMDELMNSTASAVKKLSPRQQQAMIFEINEKIDSSLQFVQSLRKHQIEINMLDWPEDEADKKLLKASLSPARQKMAASLDYDLKTHKRKM